MKEDKTYKPRTRSEIMAWLERARQRKTAWEEKMQQMFIGEEQQEYVAMIVPRSHPKINEILQRFDDELQMFDEMKP